MNRWATHSYEVMRLTRLVLIDILNMETGVRGYLLTGQKHFMEPYEQATASLKEYENELMATVKDDSDTKRKIEDFIEEISRFNVLIQAQMELRRTQGKNAIIPAVLEAQKQRADRLRDMVEGFINKQLVELHKGLAAERQKDKEFIYTLIIGAVLSVGAMVLATVMLMSFAERSRKAEEEVRKGEERFRMVMDGVNDGIFDYDLRNRTIYYSPAYKAMLGYSESEYPNSVEMFEKGLHPDDREATMAISQGYRNREIPVYRNIFRMQHKNGSWRWILSRGVGIWDEGGRMVRLIGTHTDITEQKRREEELQELNSDLESFTYITSHDLRSPLVNLKGFSGEMEYALKRAMPILQAVHHLVPLEERAVLEEALDKEIPEALTFIKKSVEKMDMLTNAVLNLSRIGKREYMVEAVDTEAVVKRCLDSLAYEISKKEVEVVCGPLLPINSDLLAIEQIFGNILDNAIKYLVPQRKGRIVISSAAAGKDIIYSVEDNGRGIVPNDRKKIFDVFRRARNTGDVRGMGIGMAYVKATLRRLGGVIWFESAIDKGTTFYFKLANQDIKG